MFRVVLVFAYLSVATLAYAKPNYLSGTTIRNLVSGSVLFINTPLNTKLPVRYGTDGSLKGRAGSVAFYLGAATDTGRWWVARNRLCHRWKRWFDGETQCLKLRRTGRHIYWQSDEGKSGTAIINRVKPVASEKQVALKQTPATRLAQSPATELAVQPKARTEKAPVKAAAVKVAKAPSPARPKSETPKLGEPKRLPSHGASLGAAAVSVKKKNAVQAPAVEAKKPKRSEPDTNRSGPYQTAWRRLPLFRVTHVASFDVLNVRQGPSEYHDIVGRIPHQGRGVKIVGDCRSWWCPVRHENTSGWVNRYYLAAEY